MNDLGDFQTPPALVAAVLGRLARGGERWPRVLEPTCGRGHFLAGLLAMDPPPREVFGVEVQPGHLAAAREVARAAPGSVRVELTEASLFRIDLNAALDWRGDGPLLVVGNPPWVTNSALGALGSDNRPARANVKNARGLDARTGAANFDIAEAVWLKLLTELADQRPTVALLCKTSVARNVLEHAARAGLAVAEASVVRVDARAWFGASVEACLLCVRVGPGPAPARVPVFADLTAAEPAGAMRLVGGRLVADADAYEASAFADGVCLFEWRQGVKHDAAAVMELAPGPGGRPVNGRGEPVDVEPGYVFPLLKGRDLARPGPAAPGGWVVVTQRTLADDTSRLEREAPRLWAYLAGHEGDFARRKSSVYRGRPAYAMFGVGPYAMAPYKVAVSGLHRRPVFHAVGPAPGQDGGVDGGGRPVMLDDTGYFLPFDLPEPAALAAAVLNEPGACGLLAALALPGAKRPVTKAALRRLDLPALFDRADRPALLARAGGDVRRLAGRDPDWPEDPASLLEPVETP